MRASNTGFMMMKNTHDYHPYNQRELLESCDRLTNVQHVQEPCVKPEGERMLMALCAFARCFSVNFSVSTCEVSLFTENTPQRCT